MLPASDGERTLSSSGADVPITSPSPLTTTDDDTLPTVGHIGRYALKYAIGEGGLGTVYAAHDPVLSRLIAIKTLNLDLGSEEREQFNALFLNEARAAAGLSHPHIVTVHDAGLSDQGVYIAMELLKGKDLRQLLRDGWRPTEGQVALIVRRVADALAYAHSRGVIHRDIKPANIFMVGRTQPRVLDFGIARVAHQHDVGDTVAGSPYYMSPEQLDQRPTDRRTDVFSLGVVLYELLTGVRPFRGDTLADICEAVRTHTPELASQVNPAVPQGLAEITARAMEKDPAQRYSSARSMSRELRHWLDEHPQRLGAAAEEPRGLSRPRAIAAGVAAVVVGAAALALWPRSPSGPAVPAPAAVSATTGTPAAPATPAAPPAGTEQAAAAAPAAPRAPQTAAADAAPEPPREQAAPDPAARKAAREAAEAKARKLAAAKAAKASAAQAQARTRVPAAAAEPGPPPTGRVQLAVSPWANVEVDGKPVGTTPPMNAITLPEGRHSITLRNDGSGSHTVMVNVDAQQPVVVKHKFPS